MDSDNTMEIANTPEKSHETSVQNLPFSQTPKSKSLLLIIVGFFFFLVLGGVGAYYAGTQSEIAFQTHPRKTNKTKIQTTPTPITTTNAPKEYKTRYFNVTDFFGGRNKYPDELTQIAENSLIPISCTQTYSAKGSYFANGQAVYDWYDNNTQKFIPLTDASLLRYIEVLHKKYAGKTVIEISACSSEQGKTVIFYNLGPCQGGCAGIPYVGVTNGSDINEVANIGKLEDASLSFACEEPLELTKENIFYFECRHVNGPPASQSLYKLSLANLTISRMLHCTAGIDQDGGQYSKCE